MDIDITEHEGLVGRVVTGFLPFLRKTGGSLSPEDLMQAGRIGLAKAKERFDPDRGYAFSTFATWWIRAEVKREYDNNVDTIRKPVHIRDEVRSNNKTSPYREMPAHCTSFEVGTSDGNMSILDAVPSECDSPLEALQKSRDEDALKEAIGTLTADERFVIQQLFFRGASVKDTATELGVSREWARQLRMSGIAKLREKLSGCVEYEWQSDSDVL